MPKKKMNATYQAERRATQAIRRSTTIGKRRITRATKRAIKRGRQQDRHEQRCDAIENNAINVIRQYGLVGSGFFMLLMH